MVVPRIYADDPFLWKERYFATRLPADEAQTMQSVGWGIAVVFLVSVGLGLFVGVIEAVAAGRSPAAIVNPVLRVVMVVAAAALAPLAGLRAALSVGRERQQQTLDSLFTLPVDRADVLRAKWRAAGLWARPWLFALAAVAAVAAASGSVHPVGLLAAAVLLAGYLPFAVSFGLWLSVRCATTVRAATTYLAVLIALSIVPLMLGTLVRTAAAAFGESAEWLIDPLFRSVSVPRAMWELCFADYHPSARPEEPTVVVLAGLAVAVGYGLVAWALWRDARRRFEQEGR